MFYHYTRKVFFRVPTGAAPLNPITSPVYLQGAETRREPDANSTQAATFEKGEKTL